MGLTRKLLSTVTLGAVDMRSDKERTARHTAKTARAVKRGNRLIEEQNRLLGSPAAPPGWYPDPAGQQPMRWWDGKGWR